MNACHCAVRTTRVLEQAAETRGFGAQEFASGFVPGQLSTPHTTGAAQSKLASKIMRSFITCLTEY